MFKRGKGKLLDNGKGERKLYVGHFLEIKRPKLLSKSSIRQRSPIEFFKTFIFLENLDKRLKEFLFLRFDFVFLDHLGGFLFINWFLLKDVFLVKMD